MPNIFTTGLFKSPKFSVFPCKHTNKLSCGIGRNVPVAYEQLGPGDRYVSDIGQLTRFAPLAAPTMDEFEVTYDTFFVPFRIMNPKDKFQYLDNYEDFDNYYENVDGTTRLNVVRNTNVLFTDVLSRSVTEIFSIKQSLYDFLGYPMYDNYRKAVRESLSVGGINALDISAGAVANKEYIDLYHLPVDNKELADFIARFNSARVDEFISPVFTNPVYDSMSSPYPVSYLTFLMYVLYFAAPSQFSFTLSDIISDTATVPASSIATCCLKALVKIGMLPSNSSYTSTDTFILDWSKAWDAIGFHEDDVLKSYFDFITFVSLVGIDDDDNSEPFYEKLPYREVNFLPFYAYKRCIGDWYLNQLALQNQDGEDWYISEVNRDVVHGASFSWECSKRQWANDYFTSAFPSPQAGQAVLIPVSGTMQDLRASNSLIKFKERLMYAGKKIKDQLYAIFGVHSSDARLDMSEVIKREVFNLNIQTITQVSAGDTPLATLAGNGVSSGAKHLVDYTAEEAGIIMTIMSVRPRASYFQGVRRLLTKRDLTEFLIPDFANVGAQQIDNSELYLDYNSVAPTGMFAYTRKYACYMFENSEVHGSFRDDLDFWHAARQFTSQPSFGTDFMSVDAERDNLNRIFAVRGDENIYCYLFFDNKVVRPLPKYVQYSW